MKKLPLKLLSCFTVASAVSAQVLSLAAERSPNIIFILTDNQGAWSLGTYGNHEIRTPNIDKLASEGIKFTRALSSNPVSSPTRATYLTGLIPSQHGVHSYIPNPTMLGPDAYNMIEEFTSLSQILKDEGYICGLSGKWHLGDHLAPKDDFSYWVTKPGGHTVEFYDQDYIENGKIHTHYGHLTDFWTARGIQFIRQNKDEPFFLLLAYNGPYNLGHNLMLKPPRNRHAEYYKGKHFTTMPMDLMHPWQNGEKQHHGTQNARERLAAETSGVDDGVGDIMAELKRLGIDDNTIIIYSADQGHMAGQNGMWGMGDHFRPIGAHELMMRIPLIFRHPGKIPSDTLSDIIVSNYDFMTTLLNYLNLGDKMPEKPVSPGRDYSPVLRGEEVDWNNVMFYEMENTRAIRTVNWKYVARYPEGPFELYNIEEDPQERFNLYGQPGTEGKINELSRRLNDFFNKYANPEYNIWEGGRSKANRLTQ